MAKKSPLHAVVAEHGSKAELAKKVIGVLTKGEDEEQEMFEHRVNTMSNKKLLRLWNAHQTLSSKYGSRDKLVSSLVTKRFPGGNADYQAKISTFSVPKLLDLARQLKVS